MPRITDPIQELKNLEKSQEFLSYIKWMHSSPEEDRLRISNTEYWILFTHGWCEDLARYFQYKYDTDSYFNGLHYCFKYKGKYYDILDRDGVNDPKDLKFNTKIVKNNKEYYLDNKVKLIPRMAAKHAELWSKKS